jgi:hypothetical protein
MTNASLELKLPFSMVRIEPLEKMVVSASFDSSFGGLRQAELAIVVVV